LNGQMAPEALPSVERWFAIDDFTAPMASGSSLYDAMIVLPCTVGTLGAIAGGYSGNLIHRAADVTLKERRPLILAVRETPLNRTHLTNMLRVHEAGAIIFPPMPSFYHKPDSLEAMARHYAGRLCDQLGLQVGDMKRWGGLNPVLFSAYRLPSASLLPPLKTSPKEHFSLTSAGYPSIFIIPYLLGS
jgi:flavin prenyltransferase